MDATKKFKQMVDAKTFLDEILGINTKGADDWFVAEKSIMFYAGQWKPGNFKDAGRMDFVNKIVYMRFPKMTDMPKGTPDVVVGGAASGPCISSNLDADVLAATLDFTLNYYAGAENLIEKMYITGTPFVGNVTYDRSKMYDLTNQMLDYFKQAPGYFPPMDCAVPSEVNKAIIKTAFPGLVTGQIKTAEEAVASVQKAVEDYYSKQK